MNISRFFSRRTTAGFQPRVEVLEKRAFLNCDVTLAGGTLTILGDNTGNVVNIVDDGAGNVQVDCDGAAAQSFSGVTDLEVNTGNGKDWVSYNLTGTPTTTPTGTTSTSSTGSPAPARTININLGNGKDTATLGAVSADGSVVNVSQALSITVNGGNGKDQITARFDVTLTDAAIALVLNGGNGKDQITAWVTVESSAVDLTTGLPTADPALSSLSVHVNGGNGKDTLTLNVDGPGLSTPATDTTLASSTPLDLVLDGGRGKDTLVFTDNVQVLDWTGGHGDHGHHS